MIAALTVVGMLGLAFALCAILALVAVCYAIAKYDAQRGPLDPDAEEPVFEDRVELGAARRLRNR